MSVFSVPQARIPIPEYSYEGWARWIAEAPGHLPSFLLPVFVRRSKWLEGCRAKGLSYQEAEDLWEKRVGRT